MEQKKFWLMRPVAWIATCAMFVAVKLLGELVCLLGEYATYRLDNLSTIAVILFALLFGSAAIGLFFYSATFLPAVLVSLSDKIYPSHHAFRYYFIGIYEIINCASWIIYAINGNVEGNYMFWFYAQNGWFIYASVTMMLVGRSASNDRNQTH